LIFIKFVIEMPILEVFPFSSKPTIALDYNFARRTSNGVKSVANIWEVGGDLVEPRLIEIGTFATVCN
jgi:hypothetical protein